MKIYISDKEAKERLDDESMWEKIVFLSAYGEAYRRCGPDDPDAIAYGPFYTSKSLGFAFNRIDLNDLNLYIPETGAYPYFFYTDVKDG